MKIQTATDVLVIVGGWNPSIILNPEWLNRYLFPEKQEFSLEIPVFMGFPQISTETIRISLKGSKLCISPLKEVDLLLDFIEELGIKLADFLPHTPVTAMGVNFSFVEDESDDPITSDSRERRAIEQSMGTIEEEQHRYSLKHETATMNLVIRKPSKVGRIYDFNFHYSLESLIGLKQILTENSILEYKNKATAILTDFKNSYRDQEEYEQG